MTGFWIPYLNRKVSIDVIKVKRNMELCHLLLFSIFVTNEKSRWKGFIPVIWHKAVLPESKQNQITTSSTFCADFLTVISRDNYYTSV